MASVQSTKRSRSSAGQVSARAGEEHKKLRLHPCPDKYKKLQDARFPPAICSLPHVLEMINDLLLDPEAAIVTAVKRKEQQWLDYLLGRFHGIVADVLLHGASSGDDGTVAALLPSMFKPGSDELKDGAWDELEEAVTAASKAGHFAVLRCLLPKVVETGDCGYVAWNVLQTAASKGYLDILAFAADIADGENGEEAREKASDAVLYAIDGRHSAAAMFLVNRYYREWRLEEALEMAIVRGQIEVAGCIYEALLKEDYHTSLEDAFVYMAGDSLANALMYLYRRGHNDSKLIGHAFRSAAQSAGINMLTLLLDTGKVSTEAFGIAFWYAARGGRMEIVSFLSNSKLASARSIARAFESAGYVVVSRYLYEKLQNPAQATRTAFRNAARVGSQSIFTPMTDNNRIAVVRFLISTGHVPTDLITEAFMGAATGRHIEIIRALIDEQCISLDIKYGAFRKAAEAGHTQVLTYLAGKVRIPFSIKTEALKDAAQSANARLF